MTAETVMSMAYQAMKIALALAGPALLAALAVGLIISIFTTGSDFWVPVLFCVVAGMIFGLISAAIPYGASRGQRDFASTMQLVAGRYDVLCDPGSAEEARDMLAKLAI